MSGVLEQILAELQNIRALIQANGGNLNSGASSLSQQNQQGSGGAGTGTAQQTATTQVGASGALGGGAGTVTHEMLTALVQPLVQQEGTKAQVKTILTEFGLNRLGEAQESQYPALYQRLQQINTGGLAASVGQDLI
jgi:hypothetical protein